MIFIGHNNRWGGLYLHVGGMGSVTRENTSEKLLERNKQVDRTFPANNQGNIMRKDY